MASGVVYFCLIPRRRSRTSSRLKELLFGRTNWGAIRNGSSRSTTASGRPGSIGATRPTIPRHASAVDADARDCRELLEINNNTTTRFDALDEHVGNVLGHVDGARLRQARTVVAAAVRRALRRRGHRRI